MSDTESHPDFIPELARHLAAHDALRLRVLYADGELAAAQFWIRTESESCIYKLACDEQYADLFAGAALSRDMFRHALHIDHPVRINYGAGSEAYKCDCVRVAGNPRNPCPLVQNSPRAGTSHRRPVAGHDEMGGSETSGLTCVLLQLQRQRSSS